jgi:mono/diheme cytochrome c family protein/glucose/arabinose dehydrogenase
LSLALVLTAGALVPLLGAQEAPPASPAPVRSPEAEMATFQMQPGYHVELVASEPLVQDPIAMDWDALGRLWLIEMPGYMPDLNPTNAEERQPTGRIVVLEDTNDDGRMDKRTVFLDGLVLPRALKVLAHGVLVGEPPNLWFVHDTNGDLVADTKELVTDTYGTRLASPEHNANSLTWAMDNWMHTSEHTGYLRWKDGTFELAKTLSRGQWGVTQDDVGRLYRNTNEAALFVDIVPEKEYIRNPDLVRTRGLYESLQNPTVNTVWPAHQTPGVNRGYQSGVLRPDGRLAHFTSVSSPTVYRGDRLPAELQGNVFVTEPAANVVSRLIVSDDGTTLVARKAYPDSEFLAATDERFRPVYLSSAPDGTLYILDLYRGIIQHRNYITEYLRDQILSRDLVEPTSHGRIYRVVHDATTRGPKPALLHATSAQLIDTLAHPNGWWRDTAQRLLVERGDRSPAVIEALTDRAEHAPDLRTRLHALWTLDGLDRIEPEVVIHALADSSRDVRVAGLRLSERWLASPPADLKSAVLGLMSDTDWNVRRQLAATLGDLPSADRVPAVATMLSEHGDDPVTVDAALSGIHDDEVAVLDRLLASTTQGESVESSIAMLSATIVRGGDDAKVQHVFDAVAETGHPSWQRSALLRGAEIALAGAPMPPPMVATTRGGRGGRGGGRAAAPCSGCPGARNGPGGQQAFPETSRAANAGGGGRGRGRGGPQLTLQQPPSALVALSRLANGGDLAERAANVLDHVTWAGKAGAAPAAAPLTAEEQRRFDAGKQVYAGLCIACHQADGRGRENVAASLVGSSILLGAPRNPIRVLMNGKEGTIGLMPPLGTTLTDEQIADVLTYVRNEWGQHAPAVTPDLVATVRRATASRTKPWTNAELEAAGGTQ